MARGPRRFTDPSRGAGSAFGLDDRQDIAAGIDEPRGPRVAHVGDAVGRDRVRRRIVLDPDSAAPKILHFGPNVRDTPCTLSLYVTCPDRAQRDDKLRSARSEDEPIALILANQLQAENVAVEMAARVEILRQEDRKDDALTQQDEILRLNVSDGFR